ncbi:MAG: DUF4962 domain-containing protein [Chitinophagales bacterium]
MECDTNVALASFGTRPAVDSFWAWYRAWPVNDGQRNDLDEEGRWGKVRWLSAPTAVPHWVQLLFPGEQVVHRVEVWWAREESRFLRPHCFELQYWDEDAWAPVTLTTCESAADERVDRLSFAPVRTERLRLWMPAGAGPDKHPSVLGVAELEAYSAQPNPGPPSRVPVLPPRQTARTNPCFFNWAPVPEAVGYLLEYGADPGFEPAATIRRELAVNHHLPETTLPPGICYWRVAARGPAASGDWTGPWSEPALIEVAEDVFTFTLPRGWDEPAQWQSRHPRLAATAVGRDRLAAWAAGPKASLWAKLQATLDGSLAYVAQLSNMASKPPETQGEPPAEPPGFTDGLWRVERWREILAAAAQVLDVLVAATFAFYLSGEERYRELARRWLLHAAQWDPDGPTGIGSVDHAAHDVLAGLATAYDLLYNDLTVSERDLVRSAITRRCESLYDYLNPFENDPSNNHPWFHTTALGLGALAIWDEVPAAVEWVRLAARLYAGRFLCLGGRDGDWHEGSSYWSYGLGFVFNFCDNLKTVTGLDLYQHPWLKRTARFKLYVHLPGGQAVPFGDHHGTPPNAEDAARMLRLASVYRDPLAQWWGLEALTHAEPQRPELLVWLFLWWDPALAPEPPGAAEPPPAAVFAEAGWAVFHTTLQNQDGVHFALRSGKAMETGASHTHADLNHLVLRAGGEDLLLDSGVYDYYGSPHFAQWFTQTRAHNTILVDGAGQGANAAGAGGAITGFLHTGTFDYVVAEVGPGAYPGRLEMFRRHVLFRRPAAETAGGADDLGWFLVFDEVKGLEPLGVQWLWHTSAEPELFPGGLRFRRGSAGLCMRFLPAAGLATEISHGFPPGAEPERPVPEEWHVALQPAARQDRFALATLLLPFRAGAPCPSGPPDRDVFAVRPAGETSLQVAGWETDGLLFAATGAPASWFAAGATRVRHGGPDGCTCLEADSPVSLAVCPGATGLQAAVITPTDVCLSLRARTGEMLPFRLSAGTHRLEV